MSDQNKSTLQYLLTWAGMHDVEGSTPHLLLRDLFEEHYPLVHADRRTYWMQGAPLPHVYPKFVCAALVERKILTPLEADECVPWRTPDAMTRFLRDRLPKACGGGWSVRFIRDRERNRFSHRTGLPRGCVRCLVRADDGRQLAHVRAIDDLRVGPRQASSVRPGGKLGFEFHTNQLYFEVYLAAYLRRLCREAVMDEISVVKP